MGEVTNNGLDAMILRGCFMDDSIRLKHDLILATILAIVHRCYKGADCSGCAIEINIGSLFMKYDVRPRSARHFQSSIHGT